MAHWQKKQTVVRLPVYIDWTLPNILFLTPKHHSAFENNTWRFYFSGATKKKKKELNVFYLVLGHLFGVIGHWSDSLYFFCYPVVYRHQTFHILICDMSLFLQEGTCKIKLDGHISPGTL